MRCLSLLVALLIAHLCRVLHELAHGAARAVHLSTSASFGVAMKNAHAGQSYHLLAGPGATEVGFVFLGTHLSNPVLPVIAVAAHALSFILPQGL